jgi:tetratricopeptide (TPR) repeat protein
MNSASVELSGSKPAGRRRVPWLSPRVAAALLVLAGLLAYANSFQGSFVYDDGAILDNPTIRHLWPPGAVLFPGGKGVLQGATVAGRPLVNLSFAINYAFGGLNPAGYHAVNLLIHLLAGLVLFGIMRRTLMRPRFRSRFEDRETGIALAVALIWLLHPLQTESVTYLVQRAESLAGLFYLLTLYLAVRGFEENRGGWYALATLTSLLAMACKETAASLPVIVLLYDRLFVAESYREIFRKRGGFYFSLALTWGALAALILMAKGRGGTVGFGHGITSWEYARAQFGAIVLYLKLSLRPSPLILDYGSELPAGPCWPAALIVAVLLAGTLAALRARSWIGFAGAWFFLILAPSSSVVPVVTQIMAEHRMYLPLAAVVVLGVIGADRIWRVWTGNRGKLWRGMHFIPAAVVILLAAALAWGTVARNAEYRSALGLWQDTEMKRPGNSRAHLNVGKQLAGMKKLEESALHFREALKINPQDAKAWCGLAEVLALQGKFAAAIPCDRKAVQIDPEFAEAYFNLGAIFVSMGKPEEAVLFFRHVLEIDPGFPEADFNLATTLVTLGKTVEAEQHYRRALEARPEDAGAHFNLGALLAAEGKPWEAIGHYRRALEISPGDAEIYTNLGNAYAMQGGIGEAVWCYRRGLELNPDDSRAHFDLGKMLEAQGKKEEAAGHYRRAAELEGKGAGGP